MSKHIGKHQLSDKRKTNIVMIVSVLLAVANFIPFHYATHYDCPHGGGYTESGVRLGVPVSYAGTIHDEATCPGVYGDAPSKGFSISALFVDALAFGVVMVGLNVLLDRRTKV